MSVLSSVVGNATLALRYSAALTRKARRIQKLDAIETLRAVVGSGASLSRFGDGELHFAMQGKRLYFQPWRMALAVRLQRALLERNDQVLTAFNHHAAASNEVRYLNKYPRYEIRVDATKTLLSPSDISILRRARARRGYARYWRVIEAETKKPRYGEASVFFLAIYVEEYVRGEIETILDLFRRLFAGRRILFVAPERPIGGPSFRELEPDMRRLGLVAADYIAVPPTDTFAAIADIEAAILARRGFDDVFIQAGPVATVLASELAGRIDGRILDVGSLNTQVCFLL